MSAPAEIDRAQDFKPEGKSAEAVKRLHDLAFQLDAANLTIEQVRDALEAGKDTLWQPTPRVAAAIAKVCAHVITEPGEQLVKAYNMVQHNSTGMEQERLIVLTTRGYYRVTVDYVAVDANEEPEKCVKKSDFASWPAIQLVCFSYFTFNKSLFPSVAQFTLKAHIEHLYGIRVLLKDQPKPPGLPFPPAIDRYIDNCYRTYRPMSIDGPADGEDAKEWMERDRNHLIEVTGEIMCVFSLCIRTCPEIRAMTSIHSQPVNYYNPVAYTRGGLSTNVLRGIVSTVYNKGKKGFAKPAAEAAPAE